MRLSAPTSICSHSADRGAVVPTECVGSRRLHRPTRSWCAWDDLRTGRRRRRSVAFCIGGRRAASCLLFFSTSLQTRRRLGPRRDLALFRAGIAIPHRGVSSANDVTHGARSLYIASMKTSTVGVRLEPALLDRLDVVAARWSATSPIPITYDRSTIVRGLMQRALVLVEAELGITPAVATAPADRSAVLRSAKPATSARGVKSAKRGR